MPTIFVRLVFPLEHPRTTSDSRAVCNDGGAGVGGCSGTSAVLSELFCCVRVGVAHPGQRNVSITRRIHIFVILENRGTRQMLIENTPTLSSFRAAESSRSLRMAICRLKPRRGGHLVAKKGRKGTDECPSCFSRAACSSALVPCLLLGAFS